MKYVISIFVLLSSTLAAERIVSAYYENWSQYRPPSGGRKVFFPNLIDPLILTDFNYAFAIFGFVTKSIDPQNPHLTGNYTVQPVEWNDQSVLYPQVQALKQQNRNLRTHISIGGWGFNDPNDPNGIGQYTYKLFSDMVSNSANRSQFIQSAVAYAKQWGFNGIDIDWEFPGDLTRGGKPEDFDNFVTFLQEFYPACQSASLKLSAASAAIVPAGVPQSFHDNPASYFQWLAKCAEFVDYFNVMCYDYHGPFDVPMLTGVNAPLNRDTNPDGTLCDEATLTNYLNNGVPAGKIVLGMPVYGHSYGGVAGLSDSDNGPGKPFTSPGNPGPSTGSPGMLAYFEIADMTALKQLTFGTDAVTSTALGYTIGEQQWVSFDTPDTIALKTQKVIDKGLLGAMLWAIDDDEYQWGETYPNVRKAYGLLNGSVGDR
jgi:chitinase